MSRAGVTDSECGVSWDGTYGPCICVKDHGHRGRHRCGCGAWSNVKVLEVE